MGKKVVIAAGVAIATAIAPFARAANENTPMMLYLGYTALFQQYGASLANGSNVSVALDESNGYPVLADGRFSDKTLILTYNQTPSGDSHATTVGAEFFGNDSGFSQRSVAPHLGATSGGSSVQLYRYDQFNGAYLLNPGSIGPYGSNNNARVASHAYNYSDFSLNEIARMDYLEQRDDFIQVVGNNFYGSLGDTFNSIVVVSTDGAVNSSGALVKTDAINTSSGAATAYTAGRVSPTVTGPFGGSPSDAIGQVAGVVGLLVSRGKTTNSFESYTTATTTAVAPYTGTNFTTYTKAGYTVTGGDTSEVVKAAIMAGALRNVATYTNGLTTVNGITDYRVAAANQTANGLDYRWGAGMVNAQNSYYIVNAGETNSSQDTAGQKGGGIGQYGFDYDAHFGGANGSNNTATYGFTANAAGKFMASLVWNVKIAGAATPSSNFDPTPTLYNMYLTLTDMTTGAIVQQSASNVDNTQTVWADVTSGDQYMLIVNAGGTAFDWDYGLAWRSEGAITALAVPEPTAISLVSLGAASLLRRRRVAK